LAQVVAPGDAVKAPAADKVRLEKDAISHVKFRYGRPPCIDDARDLMAGHDRQLDERMMTVERMEVRSTDADGGRANAKFCRSRLWCRCLDYFHMSRALDDCMSHNEIR
jgi:hypothetical protein